ncbi:hypothetical protein FTO70_09485 [Methanosarcina sp. KYL-1]|uniref:Ig-like domain-containing protein n=1 Tax=Methanosarcina sp. KYL-1 TaxID=2602068 RepID=UPI00210106B8|nr:Ig-like domain-containing protein [Methanosarcina sp. KYL-1]MCQ1535906.1 hypothetical protein [Methanosarcina sp. KYL-1]
MNKAIMTIGIVAMLLLAALPLGASATGSSNVCRDLPSGDLAPGSTITVSLGVTVGSATYYAIDEEVPEGWTVTGASGSGDYTKDPGHVKWVITSGAADTTYTYTVEIPEDASGAYTFNGEFMMEGMADPAAIDCDTQVNVADDVTGGDDCSNVCRDLPEEDQAPGSTITVKLDVTVDSATYYAIDEEVPEGWTVTGASGSGDYTKDPGHVKWVITSGAADTTYTYTVEIPEDASGAYTFNGEFMMEGMADPAAIDCDTQVNVADDVTGGDDSNVCRDLPEEDQAPGSTITVKLDVTVDSATYYAIDEVVPAGWTITGASGSGDYNCEPGHVKWVITSGAADTTYTYTVEIPEEACGTYTFDGEFMMEGMSEPAAIDCDTQINVAEVVLPDGLCLTAGWNFVSIPYTLEKPAFKDVLCGLSDVVTCVQYYDASATCTADKWVHSLSMNWEPLKGYWIYAKEDCCIPAEKLVRKQTNNVLPALKLYPGWNAVGSPETSTQYANCAFVTVEGYYSKVVGPWVCDNGYWDYQYTGYKNGCSDTCYDETHMTVDLFPVYPYKGYWMYVTDDCCTLA